MNFRQHIASNITSVFVKHGITKQEGSAIRLELTEKMEKIGNEFMIKKQEELNRLEKELKLKEYCIIKLGRNINSAFNEYHESLKTINDKP